MMAALMLLTSTSEMPKWLDYFVRLSCSILWTIAYILIIYRSFKDKSHGMPFEALALNFACETFIGVWIFTRPDLPNIQGVIDLVWAGFDVFIIIAFFKFRDKHIAHPGFHMAWLVVNVLIAYGICAAMVIEFENQKLETAAFGFGINVIMSYCFITMLIHRRSLKGQSIGIAVTKLLGTAIPCFYYGIIDPSAWILCAGIVSLVLDLIYLYFIVLLTIQRKQGKPYNLYARPSFHKVSK